MELGSQEYSNCKEVLILEERDCTKNTHQNISDFDRLWTLPFENSLSTYLDSIVIYLSIFLSIFLSIYLSIYLYITYS